MKKWIAIGFIGFLAVFIIVKQLNHNDFSASKQLAESGKYEEFYASIQNEIERGNSAAKEILIGYFLKAIQEKKFEELKFYLDNNKELINQKNESGDRAIDVVLFDESINIELLKLLLSYNPDLNYVIRFYEMTPLQVVVTNNKNMPQDFEVVSLLIKNGADVNFYTKDGKSEHSTLSFSFATDKLNIFELLLKNGADLTNVHFSSDSKNKNDILANIAGSYVIYLKNQNINLAGFYERAISHDVHSAINSNGYKILHNRNMKYLNAIATNSSFSKASDDGIEALVKWYIKTSEYDGLKQLGNYGVFKREPMYTKMKEFALKENDRVAINILNQYKGN